VTAPNRPRRQARASTTLTVRGRTTALLPRGLQRGFQPCPALVAYGRNPSDLRKRPLDRL